MTSLHTLLLASVCVCVKNKEAFNVRAKRSLQRHLVENTLPVMKPPELLKQSNSVNAANSY